MNFLNDIFGQAEEAKNAAGDVMNQGQEAMNQGGDFLGNLASGNFGGLAESFGVQNPMENLGGLTEGLTGQFSEWTNLGADNLAHLGEIANNFGFQNLGELAQNLPQNAFESVTNMVQGGNWGGVQDLLGGFFGK